MSANGPRSPALGLLPNHGSCVALGGTLQLQLSVAAHVVHEISERLAAGFMFDFVPRIGLSC